MKFNYYYGIESEQFSFYRIPRILIKDERFKKLSNDAKLLYGLMLDRMSLSMKNEWLDDENRVYIIYTVDSIMEDLGYSKPTCTKIMRELDAEDGIGLIEKKRRGRGKPDIIYVKNFVSIEENEKEEDITNTDTSTEVQDFDFKTQKRLTSGSQKSKLQEVKNLDFQKKENLTSKSKEFLLQEVKKFSPNYTNINYTNYSYTNNNHIHNNKDTYISTQARVELMKVVQTVTDHLNKLGGKNYKYDDNVIFSYVSKLLDSGYTLDDLLFVVDNKCKQWAKFPDKSNWLRPQTLFGENFTSYLNETKRENYEYPDKQKKTTKNKFINFEQRDTDYNQYFSDFYDYNGKK